MDIGAEGEQKPIPVVFQESFGLATCFQGSVRNQGDQLSSLSEIEGFPGIVGVLNAKIGIVVGSLDENHPRTPAPSEGIQVTPVSLPASILMSSQPWTHRSV